MKTTLILSLIAFVFIGFKSGAEAAPAKVSTVKVNCQSPMLGYQTSISGLLSVKPHLGGGFQASGRLKVQMGPVTPRLNPIKTILFNGKYDKFNSTEYATLGADNRPPARPEISMLYINFKDNRSQSNSYIEMLDGIRQPLNCSTLK